MTEMYSDLLSHLKEMPQGTKIEINTLKKLKPRRVTPTLLLCIHEVLRISAPTRVLDKKIIDMYFMNLKLMGDVNSVLVDVISYKTILLLGNKEFVQFLEYMADIPHRDILMSIFDIYCKENKVDDIFLYLVKNLKNKLFVELLQKECFIDHINKLEDKEFMAVFMVYGNKKALELRNLKNRILKKKYINLIFENDEIKNGNTKKLRISSSEAKITSFESGCNENTTNSAKKLQRQDSCAGVSKNKTTNSSDDLTNKSITFDSSTNGKPLFCKDFQRYYSFFSEDKQVMVYLIQDRKCCITCSNILNKLADDENNKVRARAIKYADFDNEWLLDASKEVRQAAIQRAMEFMYDETLLYMFKGVMTKAKDEFVSVLCKLTLDFDFLYTNRNQMGVKPYLSIIKKKNESQKIENYDNVDEHCNTKKLRFYFKYFIHEEIDITRYLEDDPYTAYLYLKDKEENINFMQLLRENLHRIENITHYMRVVLYLKDYIRLHDTYDASKILEDRDYILYSLFSDISACDIKGIDNINFCKALFLAKLYNKEAEAASKLNHYLEFAEKDDLKKLEVIFYSNCVKLLSLFYSSLDSIELSSAVSKLINLHKNSTSLCFYLLRGGGVKIYSSNLIIDALICVGNIKNIKENTKLKQAITSYVNGLTISNKNELFALVSELKMYRQSAHCDYIIDDNQIRLSSIPLQDYNMYYMCDLIKRSITSYDECTTNVNRNDLYPIESTYVTFFLQRDFTKC